jgi:hypothetical protein
MLRTNQCLDGAHPSSTWSIRSQLIGHLQVLLIWYLHVLI